MTAETIDTVAAPRSYGLGALLPFIASKRTHFIITVVSGVLAQIATVVAAATGAWLVGHAVQGAAPHTLIGAFWVLGIAVVAAASCKWWQMFISHDFAYGLIEVLQVGIYDGLERAAPAYVLGRRTGDLASVATSDADLMEWFYAHVLGDYIGAVIVPLGALATLAFIHPLMALVLLPFLPLVASVPFWLAKRAGEQGRQLLAALGASQCRGRRRRAGPARARRVRRGKNVPAKTDARDAARPCHPDALRRARRAGAGGDRRAAGACGAGDGDDRAVARRHRAARLRALSDGGGAGGRGARPHHRGDADRAQAGRAARRRRPRRHHLPPGGAGRGSRHRRLLARRRRVGAVRGCDLRLWRPARAGAARHELFPRAGRDGGARRHVGRRQEHLRQSADAVLGPAIRHGADRRLRHPRPVARRAAPAGRAGAAGCLSLQRLGRRQYPPRPARRDRGRDRARGERSPRRTTSSWRCPRATTRPAASAARGSRAGSASASPSPAPFCATRRC